MTYGWRFMTLYRNREQETIPKKKKCRKVK